MVLIYWVAARRSSSLQFAGGIGSVVQQNSE
jgi:hypothetical protein